MTIDLIHQALMTGSAVILPNPPPLTHVVAARTPEAVNLAKGRPGGQAVALWGHDPEVLAQVLEVADADAELARRLLVEERVTLLVRLRDDVAVPPWLVPASKDGWMLLFGARWEPVLPVLSGHPVLYVSSANRTGHPPASTFAEAQLMGVPVLDLGVSEGERRATTTVRLHPSRKLELHRPGAQSFEDLLTAYA